METQTQLERDNSPPDKMIGTIAPKPPEPKPTVEERGCSFSCGPFSLLFLMAVTAYILWRIYGN